MSTPTDTLRQLLARVRRELYAGKPDALWFKQQKMVQKALTYPARWLKDRQVPLSAALYQAILDGIITTMVRKGDLARVEFMSRYLLHCVQQHMAHHGDDYYAEGKSIRNRVGVFMATVERRAAHPAEDQTITILAEAHDALQLTKRRPKCKAAASPLQPDLFGTAKGPKK